MRLVSHYFYTDMKKKVKNIGNIGVSRQNKKKGGRKDEKRELFEIEKKLFL